MAGNHSKPNPSRSGGLPTDRSGPADPGASGERARPVVGESPAPAKSAESLPFERLDSYRILDRLGSGGMGDVYLALDESIERRVAIKVLPTALARHERSVRRFHAEAAAAAKVIHPNVVRVHHVGRDAGRHFFSMQYVEGESLGGRLRRGRISVDESLRIVEQCLLGLQAAHAQGLIHRDVKPGNILLDAADGRAMLADFGLVYRIDQNTRMTATGVILGTANYMAPEQARSQDVDHRADLYSLGVVFYQMLSGQLPFEAETPAAMMFQHAYRQPAPLSRTAADCPPPIRHVIQRLMAKAPSNRYQNCQEVLDDLAAYREGRPIAASARKLDDPATEIVFAPQAEQDSLPVTDLPGLHPGSLWSRVRNWAVATLGKHGHQSAAQVAQTTRQVDAAVVDYQRRRDRLAELQKDARGILKELSHQIRQNLQARAEGQREFDSAADRQQRDLAAQRRWTLDEDIALLREHYDAQQHELDEIGLQLAKADATLASLRSQRDLLLARLQAVGKRGRSSKGERRVLSARKLAMVATVVVLATVSTLLLVGWRPGKSSPATGPLPVVPEGQSAAVPEVVSTQPEAPSTEPETVSTGSKMASTKPKVVESASRDAADVLPPGPLKTITCSVGGVRSLAVTPDGKQVWAATSEGFLCLWEIDTGRRLWQDRFVPEGEDVLSAAAKLDLSGDGLHAVCCGTDGALGVWDQRSRRASARIDTSMGRVADVAFSPRGDYLLAGGGTYWSESCENSLSLWDRQTGDPVRRFELPGLRVQCVAFSPDGLQLAAAGHDNTIRLLDTSDGSQGQILRGHFAAVQSMVFVPHGRRILSGSRDTTVRLWDLESGRQLYAFEGHTGGVRGVAVSDDGRYGLSASNDRTLRLLSLVDRNEIARLEGHTDHVICVTFMPDNRFALTGGDDGTLRLWRLPVVQSAAN